MTNNGAKIKYLLDTNVLIEFSVWKPISLNLNKDFWTGFETALRKNDWILLDVVAGEVKYDNDLIGWINNQKKNGLVEKIKTDDRNRAAEINNSYKMIDEITFKSTVDTYLIAYAEANNLGIFTRENHRKNMAELYKIPDVCD
ncbi:MAG TPA: DUF4411 family protein, partial [Candidatus Pacearchaeota archaeon]|nr:DUF4411 family protein [Candidatus Pacearchaeota archaeon]